MATIRNPVEWVADQFRYAERHAEAVGHSLLGDAEVGKARLPAVRKISVDDLKEALSSGLADFAACRSDVIFICIVFPIGGLVLARVAMDFNMLPLLFPVISGFALIGPAAAVGLYEMSRRREQGLKAGWADAFRVVRSPSFGAVFTLALILLVIFFIWLAVAQLIYAVTLGPEPPASFSGFVSEVFTTARGWTMALVGIAVGAVFAMAVLAISVISFPLLLDRDVGLVGAVTTSLRAVAVNPLPMALWGLIVAGGLVLGSLPVFLGLIVVMPVLGHATWHLYRKTIEA